MANILVSIEKGIEIGAEDVLKWLVSTGKALHVALGLMSPADVPVLAGDSGVSIEFTTQTRAVDNGPVKDTHP